jgi:UDP-N-acetylmuramoyl-tripeptide--D-alanyl-D-alanine ligase
MELTAVEIAAAAGGTLQAGSTTARASSFSIDSRVVEPGGCFVALVAARDGHDYVADAWERGAAVAVVSQPVAAPPPGRAVVVVDDGLGALAGLGRAARDRLGAIPVVAVTGSAGKTATKDLTAAALAPRLSVHRSPVSFNNEAGVPLTLLGAAPGTEVVVTEMGARYAGNIAELAAIARPTIGIVTNVGLAHAGLLGGREGIAAVKGELVEALPADGAAVLNADCPSCATLAARATSRVVRVGRSEDADVRVVGLRVDDRLHPSFTLSTRSGDASVTLALQGEHQATNAAMAAAVALEVGVPLAAAAAGLAGARSAPLRMVVEVSAAGVLVINDAYNSSPTSAAAALRALGRVGVSGQRVAVLGEMLELGRYAPAAHAELGVLAAEVGVDLLVTVGEGARPIGDAARTAGVAVVEAVDPSAARLAVTGAARSGDAVLVKASRAVGLELVAVALLDAGSAT